MRANVMRSIIMKMVLGVAIIVMSGCASSQINLVDTGTVTIERVCSKRVLVSSVYVYQDGDVLEISGSVKRRYPLLTVYEGHVDITVLNPDGTSLREISKGYIPRRIGRGSHSWFTIRLPIILSQGAVVRVMHHSGSRGC